MGKESIVVGLDSFNLTKSGLRSLGTVEADITAIIEAYKLTPAVVRRKPEDRHSYLRERSRKQTDLLRNKWPTGNFVAENTEIVTRITSTIRAKDIFEVASFREIERVVIDRIRGIRRKPRRNEHLEYYCVRAKVAIQVERQLRGLQTWEDRFVLVKATDFDDAIRRLTLEWKDYANPYLNSDGYLVRWQLEEILDVYATRETKIDPSGTEVYSSLQERRMKKEYEWRT